MAFLGGLFGGAQPSGGLQNQSPQGGSPEGYQQIQRFGPEVQGALSQLLQMGMQGAQQGAEGFAPIRKQAETQFEQQTIPTIAERFTSMGGRDSSAFTQSLGQAGAGMQENLAGMESQYNMQQQGQLQNLLQMGLTPRFETTYQQQDPGFMQSFGAPALQGLGSILPLLLSGGLGGLGGLASLFGGSSGRGV